MNNWHDWPSDGAPMAPDQMYCHDPAHRWKPIETAPEGERILVAYKFHGVARPTQVDIKERCDGKFIWPSRFYDAYLWMPLPEPPK